MIQKQFFLLLLSYNILYADDSSQITRYPNTVAIEEIFSDRDLGLSIR